MREEQRGRETLCVVTDTTAFRYPLTFVWHVNVEVETVFSGVREEWAQSGEHFVFAARHLAALLGRIIGKRLRTRVAERVRQSAVAEITPLHYVTAFAECNAACEHDLNAVALHSAAMDWDSRRLTHLTPFQ